MRDISLRVGAAASANVGSVIAPAHRIHQHRGGIRLAAVTDEKLGYPAAVGQAGHPDVEMRPDDALHLERRMIIQESTDAALAAHRGVWSDGRPVGRLTATTVYTRDRPAGLDPGPPEPSRTIPIRGWLRDHWVERNGKK